MVRKKSSRKLEAILRRATVRAVSQLGSGTITCRSLLQGSRAPGLWNEKIELSFEFSILGAAHFLVVRVNSVGIIWTTEILIVQVHLEVAGDHVATKKVRWCSQAEVGACTRPVALPPFRVMVYCATASFNFLCIPATNRLSSSSGLLPHPEAMW